MKFNIFRNRYNIQAEQTKENFEDDYVVKSMGAFGGWQAIAITVISLGRVIAMWNLLSILFLTPATDFACKRFKDNTTTTVFVNSTCYDDCLEYEFSNNVFEDTLIEDFNLICDRAWMANFTQMMLMFGLVIGITNFGWFSDRFGRSKGMILSSAINIIFMIGSAFAPNYWIFTALRFFVGFASGGIMAITPVYTLEMVGPQHREFAGTLSLLPDSIALATLPGLAYSASTWRIYLLEFGGICVCILALLFFLPESPRWLVANGKGEEAIALMTQAAEFNNRSTTKIKENVEIALQELKLKEKEHQNTNYMDLFKTKRLAMITMSSCIAWFVTGACYYGINQYNAEIGSNVFIVMAVTGVIQIPMSPLATVIAKVFGRKAAAMGSFISIGVMMIILLLIPSGTWVSSLFGIVGALSAFFNFCAIYLYVIELYPTSIRNMGFSLSSSSSKIGAMIAPFLATLIPRWVPSLIFAVLPFIAAVICLLLPETKGRKLRDTVDE